MDHSGAGHESSILIKGPGSLFRYDALAGRGVGYAGLVYAPVVPIGHSAAASYPWNFGAWNPAGRWQSSPFMAMRR